MPRLSPSAWQNLRELADGLGFAALGVAPAEDLGAARARIFPGRPAATGLDDWLAGGLAGELDYMRATQRERQDPRLWWPPARSAIVGLVSHDGPGDPGDGDAGSRSTTGSTSEEPPSRARISRHAWGRDYHVVVKRMLIALGRQLEREVPGSDWRLCIDRGASMEKPLALLAGLGWIGKHGNLLRQEGSSWFFIGILYTDAEADLSEPFTADHCGTCTACIDACPTVAIIGPQVVDARRCLSYLNIELQGSVPAELRPGMGSWVHGCDICQDVCPWNRHRSRDGHPRFTPGPLGRGPELGQLLALDDDAFRLATPKSPIKREHRRGFVRNAAIAAGNSLDERLVPALGELLADVEPIVRAHAAWALGRIGGHAARRALELARGDADASVAAEIEAPSRARAAWRLSA